MRVAIGRVGSSASARVNGSTIRAHHFVAIALSIAKTALRPTSDSASGASRKLAWLRAMIGLGPAFCRFSTPRISVR